MIEIELVLRRASAADAPTLTSLMRTSSAYTGEYAPMVAGYVVTETHVTEHDIWVAEYDGQIWGFYELRLTPQPELENMFVADAAQGHGVGAALFEHMAGRARSLGCAAVRIVSHPPASGFYERMGARPAGVSPPAGRVTWHRPVYRLVLLPEA